MKTVRTFAHLVLFARRPQNVAEHPPRSKPAGLRSAILTLGVVVASGVLGSFASTASAAPALCEAAIATCSLESASEPKLELPADTSEAEAAVAEARQACRALRSCDRVCGVDSFEPWPKSEEPSCSEQCRGKRRRARRQCIQTCKTSRQRVRKIAVVTAKRNQRQCVAHCRRQYKTPGCQVARQRAAATLAQEGLQCAAEVSSACRPHALN